VGMMITGCLLRFRGRRRGENMEGENMADNNIAPTLERLDFDHWSRLAKEDPNEFERMRLAAIEEVISNAPKEQQQRLRGLQWRIDQERRLAKTPLGACIRISRMMWESVSAPGGLLDSLRLREVPELQRIVIAVDPPITSHAKSDACGIIIAGLDEAGQGIVRLESLMLAHKYLVHRWPFADDLLDHD